MKRWCFASLGLLWLAFTLAACGQTGPAASAPTPGVADSADIPETDSPIAQAGSPSLAFLKALVQANNEPSTARDRRESPLKPDVNRVVYMIPPKDTDSQIDLYLKDHYVMYYKNVPQNGKLFVMLPGTYGRPQNVQLIQNEAARLGWKVIGLTYPNDTTVESECNRDPDPQCAENVRLERFDGVDRTPKVQVSPANSSKNRLLKLLQYLAKTYPGEGWQNFLTADGNKLDWSKLGVAGHSQGAGMAALIGKNFMVARVMMFSGPADRNGGRPAPWINVPGQTPPDRYYGVTHINEKGYRAILASFSGLGLNKFGSPAQTSQVTSPYQNSHILVVSLPPANSKNLGDPNHGSTASDAVTPKKADGTPAYSAEWDYIIYR